MKYADIKSIPDLLIWVGDSLVPMLKTLREKAESSLSRVRAVEMHQTTTSETVVKLQSEVHHLKKKNTELELRLQALELDVSQSRGQV